MSVGASIFARRETDSSSGIDSSFRHKHQRTHKSVDLRPRSPAASARGKHHPSHRFDHKQCRETTGTRSSRGGIAPFSSGSDRTKSPSGSYSSTPESTSARIVSATECVGAQPSSAWVRDLKSMTVPSPSRHARRPPHCRRTGSISPGRGPGTDPGRPSWCSRRSTPSPRHTPPADCRVDR